MPEHRCRVCFAPGTLVRTETGYRPIETIEVGDRVLAGDGTYRRVTETMSRPHVGVAYEWRTAVMASPVISTKEHPVWSLGEESRSRWRDNLNDTVPVACKASSKTNYRAHYRMGWSASESLTKGAWVGTRVPLTETDLQYLDMPERFFRNKGTGVRRRGPQRFEVTDDFLWMIGMYLAEGSANKRSLHFALHEDEVEYQQRLVGFFTEHGYNPKIVPNGVGHSKAVLVHSSALAEWFPAWIGTGCANKKIPEELMALPPKKAMRVVDGVWCGDGYNKFNRVMQTSRVLALQMAEILQRDGRTATIHLTQGPPAPSGAARKPAYTTCWPQDSDPERDIRGRWSFREEKLARVISHHQVDYTGMVFNLEVEGEHTYVVENTLVHNCQDPESRTRVNRLLAYGMKITEIEDFIEDLNERRPKNNKITYWSLRNHAERHFNVQEPASAARRRIMERRKAEIADQMGDAAAHLLTGMAYLDIVAQKGFENLVDETTVVDYETGLKAQLKLEELQRDGAIEEQIAEMRRDVSLLQQAVKDVVPPSMMAEISHRIDELKGTTRDDVVDAEVVEDDDDDDVGYDPVLTADANDTLGED
jgi:DNA-binding transcriptional MerR regulator